MLFSAAVAGFLTRAGLIIAISAQNAFVLRRGLQHSHVGLAVAVCALGGALRFLLGVAGIGALVLRWPQLLQCACRCVKFQHAVRRMTLGRAHF